jgi:hypothetical protein
MSARCSEESLFHFPWAMNTTFRKIIPMRWCCIDQLSRQGFAETKRRTCRKADSGDVSSVRRPIYSGVFSPPNESKACDGLHLPGPGCLYTQKCEGGGFRRDSCSINFHRIGLVVPVPSCDVAATVDKGIAFQLLCLAIFRHGFRSSTSEPTVAIH